MPSAVVTAVVPVQEAAEVTAPAQIPIVLASSGCDVSYALPRRSFTSGVMACAVFHAPVLVSFWATGTGTTVGVMVLDAAIPAASVIVYVSAVATPVKAPVQLSPGYVVLDGVLLAEQGVKVTMPAVLAV